MSGPFESATLAALCRSNIPTFPHPTSDDEAARLALAEIKHGRLAMAAFAAYGLQKLSIGRLTFAHQLWGETCVNSLRLSGKAAGISTACFPQDVQSFDFVLSWEILYRVITGYFAEPYF